MFEGIYKIADRTIRIESIYQAVHRQCENYRSIETPEIQLSVSQAEIDFEREKSRQQDLAEGIAARHFPDSYLETLAVYRKLADSLLADNILLFHGSVIAVDGEAYLFTAKSGVGKSTHTRLWRELFGSRAMMINDDKPLLRVTPSKTVAYGTPWDGKHHLSTNTSAPLKTVCILERGIHNRITAVSLKEALPVLLQQTYRPVEASAMWKTLQLIELLGHNTKLYRLQCNMEPEAASVAYEGMR